MTSDLSPPWVLFVDKGKPIAILPAMRPGEVAKVGHLTMTEARAIVDHANRMAEAIRDAKLSCITRELSAISDTIGKQLTAHAPVALSQSDEERVAAWIASRDWEPDPGDVESGAALLAAARNEGSEAERGACQRIADAEAGEVARVIQVRIRARGAK